MRKRQMNSWSLLRLNPQNQERYVEHVRDNRPDIETYYPLYDRITRPHGIRHPIKVPTPVYPGYVFAFADMDSRDVRWLVSSPVKAYFIKFGGVISVIPERVITEIKRLESLRMLVREQIKINPYQPGRPVVVHTPAADIQAVIVRLMGGNRAVVDTSLGRATVRIHSITFK
jgi:Transcription termination factor nusG